MYYAFINSFLHLHPPCFGLESLLHIVIAKGVVGAAEPVNDGVAPFFPRLPFGEISRASDDLGWATCLRS
jgi:hypothetical protein